MRWREALPAARKAALSAFGALSAFVLLYVAYGHVASVASLREYRLASYEADVGSIEGLSRFTADDRGGVTHRIEGGALHVEGAARGGITGRTWSRYVGPEQRLDDVVVARLRFRVTTPGDYDVYVGVERADENPWADDPRRIVSVARVRAGAPADYAIIGDTWANGPRRVVARSSPAPAAAAADDDAGATVPNLGDGEWHELSLELAAYIHAVFAYADGEAVGSEQSKWFMGEKIRLVFGVEAREPGAPVGVEVKTAGYEQRDRPAKLASFDDRFSGKLIDPRRWVPMLPDGESAESTAAIEPGEGLHIRGHAKANVTLQPALVLLSQPTPLDTFRLKATIDVARLKGSAFIVGVLGSGPTPARFADVALRDDGKGGLETIAVGYWTGDGQLSVRALEGTWTGTTGTLEIGYDAASGEVKIWVNGTRRLAQKFDLLPGDTTQLRVGVNLQAPDAVADVKLREVKFDR